MTMDAEGVRWAYAPNLEQRIGWRLRKLAHRALLALVELVLRSGRHV